MERTRFGRPRYLFPTQKGAAPFRIYALDSMTQLHPPAPNGATAVILALDVFTKYPDYDLPPSLDSYHSTCFVHRDIVCRYGVPYMLRVDRGTEFRGELERYCRRMGIRHCPIAT